MIVALGTIILYSGTSTYFYFRYYGSLWGTVDNVITEVQIKVDNMNAIEKQLGEITADHVDNMTLPEALRDIQFASNAFLGLLTSNSVRGSKMYQMWGPMFFLWN